MAQKITDSRTEEVQLEIDVVLRRNWNTLANQGIRLQAPLNLVARTDFGPAVGAAINQVLADATALINEEIRQAAAEEARLDRGRDD